MFDFECLLFRLMKLTHCSLEVVDLFPKIIHSFFKCENTILHILDIPVLERELTIIETKPNSITVGWEGLPADLAQHVVGYVLEYKV